MSLVDCNFTNAYLNKTTFGSTQSGCVYTDADYSTISTGYVPYQSAAVLSTIISDLLEIEGIDANLYSITGLSDAIFGYVISSQSSARSNIEALQHAYFFDAYESQGKLCFVSQSTLAPTVIPEEDLGAVSTGSEMIDKLSITDADIFEVPAQVNFTYNNYANNYAQDVVRSRRDSCYVESVGEGSVSVPIVMTKDLAQSICDHILLRTWLERTTLSFQLPNKWRNLSVGQLLDITCNNISRTVQIMKLTYDGKLVKIDSKQFASPKNLAETITEPDIDVVTTGDISLYLLNLPVLNATDGSGFYAVADTAGVFKPVYMYKQDTSDPTNYIKMTEILLPAITGKSTTKLEAGPTNYMDNANSVIIKLLDGALSSVTKANVLNGANAALLGEEIIQFQTATLVGKLTYKLSGLLRGRRGTEHTIGSHTNTDTFILLTSTTIFPESATLDDLYAARTYGFGHSGPTNTIEFVPNGRGWKPLSPCHVKAVVDSSYNVALTWVRRTRFGGGWLNRIDAPVNESTESYEVVIMNGTSEVRSIFTSSPTASYTAAMQTADFGSIQSTLTIIVYQLSSVVGRGYSATITINNTLATVVVETGDTSGGGSTNSSDYVWESGTGDGEGS